MIYYYHYYYLLILRKRWKFFFFWFFSSWRNKSIVFNNDDYDDYRDMQILITSSQFFLFKFVTDDSIPSVSQSVDGYLNFTSIKKEHSGWYKCTSHHILGEFSSIGYFLNVRSKFVYLFSLKAEENFFYSFFFPTHFPRIEIFPPKKKQRNR